MGTRDAQAEGDGMTDHSFLREAVQQAADHVEKRISEQVKESLAAAGGFCAPSELRYDDTLLNDNTFTFPVLSVSRVVPKWFEPPTPAEARAQEAYRSLVNRIVERQVRARHDAVEAACWVALREGWDVHVYNPPEPLNMYRSTGDNALSMLGYVGIEFTPAKYAGLPTIHEHNDHLNEFDWDDDD